MLLHSRWGLNISQCLWHQQGSGRGPWINGAVVMSLVLGTLSCSIHNQRFSGESRAWEELCSVAEHAPESPACLETAGLASCADQLLAKPRHWPEIPGRATLSFTKCLIFAREKALLNELGHKLFLSSSEQRWLSVWKHEFLIKKKACGENYFQHTLWRFWWKC